MSQSTPDDARLRATEAQMRRALGLQDITPSRPLKPTAAAPPPNGKHSPRRRFVRDGDIPVTVVQRDGHYTDGPGASQLEAAREALRLEVAARERAERLLGEAQSAIRNLQTKLAHECLAKDELLRNTERATIEKIATERALEAAREELAIEGKARENAEQQLEVASAGRRRAEKLLRRASPTLENQKVRQAPPKQKASKSTIRIHRNTAAPLGSTKRVSKPAAKLRKAAGSSVTSARASKTATAARRTRKKRQSKNPRRAK